MNRQKRGLAQFDDLEERSLGSLVERLSPAYNVKNHVYVEHDPHA